MKSAAPLSMKTPRDADLGLMRIANSGGLAVQALPNGCLFDIEHESPHNRIMINQVLGSPIGGGIGRMLLRVGGETPRVMPIMGADARVRFGAGADRFVWEGESAEIRHRVTLWLHPEKLVWLWSVELSADANATALLPCDVVLIQDIGLGPRGFLMHCEAYASQYIDHHIAYHPGFGPVVMNRMNLDHGGRYPWVAHGCLDGAAGFATDARQLFGPDWRADGTFAFPFGVGLPSERLQQESACVGLASHALTLSPGETSDFTFFGLYEPDHAEASGDADLLRLDGVVEAAREFTSTDVQPTEPQRSVVQDVPPLAAQYFTDEQVAKLWPVRTHEERGADGSLLSFFTPESEDAANSALNRHVVLAAKETAVTRRHGTILRTGTELLPSNDIMCATCWMHGVFGAQVTLGNSALHKLFSVSRDAYSIVRTGGLRMLVDVGGGWQALGVPSAFEMGLSDCRWLYQLGETTVSVHLIASGEEAALHWRVSVDGEPCRFLVYAHVLVGEREYESAASFTTDGESVQFVFDPHTLWGERFPDARFDLFASTPGVIEAMGGDELLYSNGAASPGDASTHVAFRTKPTREFAFTVTGSLTHVTDEERKHQKEKYYSNPVIHAAMLASSRAFWRRLIGSARVPDTVPDAAAHNTVLPWLAHNALIHLSAPHGLEQFSGGAWGTRDVCQGPIEFLLALGHGEATKQVLHRIFAQQYAPTHVDASGRADLAGDWPQWFMFEPYAFIQGAPAHGDIIVWPLKALCDYIEATGDAAILDEPVAWRRQETFVTTERTDTYTAHIEAALQTIRSRFIPGTHLLRLGEGDWNDALQLTDPHLREHMVSSWTVALLHHQLKRYSEVLRGTRRSDTASEIDAFAASIRADYRTYLMADGVVAGYGLFATNQAHSPAQPQAELLIHPHDARTGIHYSLIAMTSAITGGLLTPEEAAHHLKLIRQHLAYPDGVRLMDRMMPYSGGLERLFRRAESAAFVGREIALMYVHAHLRFLDVLAETGESDELTDALAVVNPVLVTERLSHATLRQRNAFFSSSDAAFPDRYAASAGWDALRTGEVPVEGGWRIYSSGPGLFLRLLSRHWLGAEQKT